MGLNNKKYLDYAGLEKLVDIHAVVPHPQVEITAEGAYKLAFDEHGHIVSKSPLTAADLGVDAALHFIGVSTTDPTTGTITIASLDANHKNGFHPGDICLYKRSGEASYEEYIYTGTAWELLGDASSYVLKNFTITGGDHIKIDGGSDLSGTGLTISHKGFGTAASTSNIKSYDVDECGHVRPGKAILVQSSGGHSHDHATSTPVAANTYVTGVTDTHTKLSVTPTKATVLNGLTEKLANLNTTSITPVSGSTTASKATAGTAISVAKTGTAVRYGTADVGTEVTGLAKRAASTTKVGNANRAAEATIIGNADVGAAVTYGTANVGTAITVQDGKADVGAAVVYGTADVGDQITVDAGKADVGTAVAVATRASSQTTVGNANVGTGTTVASGSVTNVTAPAISVKVGSTAKAAYNAEYEADNECLVLSPVTITASAPAVTLGTKTIKEAVASETKIYAVGGTTNITPAVASNRTVSFTPATAAPSTQTLTPAVASNRTKSIAPAVASTKTLTPAKAATATIYGAVESTTEIYGVTADQVSILPAKAAPSTQTITPAVANGTITPYTFTNVTVPKAASAVTVATGSVSVGGTGASVMTGADVTDLEVMTGAALVKGTTGDVDVVDEVTTTKNSATTFTGTADTHTEGTHTHILYTE